MQFISKWTRAIKDADDHNIEQLIVDYQSGAINHDPRLKYFREKHNLDFLHISQSVVTEAHKWNVSYFKKESDNFCETCNTLDKDEAYNAVLCGGEVFAEFRETLYNHFKEAHPEKVVRSVL